MKRVIVPTMAIFFSFTPLGPASDPVSSISVRQEQLPQRAVYRAMQRLKPGMDMDEVNRILPQDQITVSSWAFGGLDSWTTYRVGRDHFLTIHSVYDGKRSEEHTSELQSHSDLVCRLLLE